MSRPLPWLGLLLLYAAAAGQPSRRAAADVPAAAAVGERAAAPPAPFALPAVPAGLPPVPVPAGNPLTPARAALGERLFFDRGLGADHALACGSCHRPERYFADDVAVSKGMIGLDGARNAASVLNAAYLPLLLSDGRAKSLEDQVRYPVANPLEMDTTQERVVDYVASTPAYRPLFAQAFASGEVTWERITQALAAFERTLLSSNSPFDRYLAGDAAALSEPARRGWTLFQEAGCIGCHAFSPERPFFSDFGFHNTGVSWYPARPQPSEVRFTPDLGRFWVSRDRREIGAFRTPSLRNVARTAPYMHDGSIATLRGVVDYYSRGPRKNPFLDPRLRPLALTAAQQEDLVAFLEALTGDVTYRPAPPSRPAGANAPAAQ
jgi:cytochrome c peroxidase